MNQREKEFERKVYEIGYEYASKKRDDLLGEVCYVLVKRTAALDQMFNLVRASRRGALATRFFERRRRR